MQNLTYRSKGNSIQLQSQEKTLPCTIKTYISFMDKGFLVKKFRTEAGLTQSELAKKIGTHKQVISEIERGKHVPGSDRLKAIAKALNVPVSQLYGDENTAQPHSQAELLILQYIKKYLSNDQLDQVAAEVQNHSDSDLAQLLVQFPQTKPESRKALLTLLGGTRE